MAEKEETITVAARLPYVHYLELRHAVEDNNVRNMSELLRKIVSEWLAGNA